MDKTIFFCIEEFNLEKQVTVTFEEEGFFVIEPPDSFADIAKGPQVQEYLVRTALQSYLDGPKSRKALADTAVKEKGLNNDTLFARAEFQEFHKMLHGSSKDNVFKMTSFSWKHLFRFFCQSTEQLYRTQGDPSKATSEKLSPEMFQILFVTSQLLKHIYAEECLKDTLVNIINQSMTTLEPTFGSKEAALKNVHLLEATPQCLPLYGKFDPKSFRRVLNTKLAATATFLAYAIYDSLTFKLALSLLQTPLAHPNVNAVFERKVGDIEPLAAEVENVEPKSYLFVHDVLELGGLFVENMVNLANRLAEYLQLKANFGVGKNPVSKRRIGALLFRTLCSDLVEIYVGHGCFPNCSKDCRKRHPWLHQLQDKFKKKNPVPLMLEFIILAIENNAIQVAASYIYTAKGNKLISNKLIKTHEEVQESHDTTETN